MMRNYLYLLNNGTSYHVILVATAAAHNHRSRKLKGSESVSWVTGWWQGRRGFIRNSSQAVYLNSVIHNLKSIHAESL